jgi:uncharacterized protein YbcI
MNDSDLAIAQQLALVARRFQEQRTGHAPSAVTVVLGEDTLVLNLHDALTPAEIALAKSAPGAAHVQEFHRQLFANSSAELRDEILRITGRKVRESAAEIETATGTVVHAFTTGSMVQVFLLTDGPLSESGTGGDSSEPLDRADDDGLYIGPAAAAPDDPAPSA